jgi:hypothetical protein
MRSRRGRPAGIAIGLAAAALVGCAQRTAPLPPACAVTAGALERALLAAPGAVRLDAGTPISVCVERARTATDLQQVGSLLSTAADALAPAAQTRPTVAVELGYLVGATRRGAKATNGVASQLRQRIETAAALRDAGPAALAALHRGILAGQITG